MTDSTWTEDGKPVPMPNGQVERWEPEVGPFCTLCGARLHNTAGYWFDHLGQRLTHDHTHKVNQAASY